MITAKDNTLVLDGNEIVFPIRVSQYLETENSVIVSLGFNYEKDVDLPWEKGGKEEWSKLNASFGEKAIIGLSKSGAVKWQFSRSGFYQIAPLNAEAIVSDQRIQNFSKTINTKDSFIVYGDTMMIVDANTGSIVFEVVNR